MSEQTTPETDGAEIIFSGLDGDAWVPASISRKLERERDEARERFTGIEIVMRAELGGHPDSELWGEAGLIAATMRCVDALGEVTEQRDEAREEIKELIYIAERAIALAEIDFENDKFGVVSELRDGLERIKEGVKCPVCSPEQKCWECADDVSREGAK